MKTIKVSLDADSIGHAIEELKAYKKWIQQCIDKLTETLAKEYALRTIADERGYTEGGDINVRAEPTEKGWRILAEGEGVFFLEFGAGDAAGSGINANQSPVPTSPGSWSETYGSGEYVEFGEWHFGGRIYDSVQPRAGMYYGFKAMTENVYKVAKEIFKQ